MGLFGTPGAIVLDKKAFGRLLAQHQARIVHLEERKKQLGDELASVGTHISSQIGSIEDEIGELRTRHTALTTVHETL